MADYVFRLDLKVYDPEALYDAAVHHAITVDKLSLKQTRELLRPVDEIDVHACLQMILDPAIIDGCNIYGSEVEQCADYQFADTEGDGL